MKTPALRSLIPAALLAVPLMGAEANQGCGGAINSRTDAPSLDGEWAITYQDDLQVRVTLGGAVHEATLGTGGGTVTIDHEGQPISFELDCARPEIVCPSETWPGTVTAEHRNPAFPHRFWVTIPRQECGGQLTNPDPATCGEGTSNPDCEQVCDGELRVRDADVFGVVDEAGDTFDLLLGAGVASNGVNCGLLGISAAHADLQTSGSSATGDWAATAMTDGEVVVGYAGACLWAGDTNGDAQLEALVLGASLELRTGFTGQKR